MPLVAYWPLQIEGVKKGKGICESDFCTIKAMTGRVEVYSEDI